MKRLWVGLILLLSFKAFSQESNCGDGIDNDGDGFIDCYDNNCTGNPTCADFFIGGDKLCQALPLQTPRFEMKSHKKSSDRTAHTLGRISVGDLDRDGIPEVVSVHTDDKKLYIINGSTFATKYTTNISGSPQYEDIALGNIKDDNCGEIFIAEKSGSNWYITSFDCKGIQLWRVQVYGQPFDLGLADFDADGKVELYYRNEILDAETGTILVKGSGDWTKIDAGPVAVDMFDDTYCTECPGLELVLGGTIYAVDLSPRTANSGALTSIVSIPNTTNGNLKYHTKLNEWGYVNVATSVADYNLDGYLDVIVSGAAETYNNNETVNQTTKGPTTVFFWDVKNNTSKGFQPANNWKNGTGRVNIADIDGDGKQNATFVSGPYLYALDENFNLKWRTDPGDISESTSGFTGTSVFDFNNDGAVEIVYRDEANLYIVNGTDGSFYTSNVCKSRTANEYPVVVDVDGDGATEICVTCSMRDTDNPSTDNSVTDDGHIRSFKSNLEPWVPARKVWNQHGYFNVNVNDDLTIPRVQQKHHLVFSTAQCKTGPGSTGANRPLNTFLNQSAYLDSKGCTTYASPDVNFASNSITITPPTCPDQNFTVSFTIRNSGDMALSGQLPISFYRGDPRQAGAVKLNTTTVNLTSLGVGGTQTITNMTVNGTGSTFTLYAVLNDAGTSVPTPIKLPNSSFVECNYDNNIVSAQITPGPFPIQTALISNNFKCGTGTGNPNGAVEAYRLVNGVKQTANYTFYWFNGTTVGDTTAAVFKGAIWTGLTEGTYSVVAYHKGLRCGSGSAQINVGVQTKTLNVTITENSPFTKCKNPDGKMTASVNGGEPVGNFTYEWFEGTVFGTSPILSKSHVITHVDGDTYSVLVTDKATGCQIIASSKVTDQTIKPVVTASATDANCNPANSGRVSAHVNNNTSNYNFYWYSGTSVKPSPDYTGSTINNLTAGDYVVIAESKSTECTSLPIMVTVGSKTSQAVTANVTRQQTSCTIPNGAASANVSGSTTGFNFKWYRGNSTLATDQIGLASSITGLAAGTYTVEAINATTGCADTELITIVDNISIPNITTSVVNHQTNCTPLNGSVSASGSGSVGPFQYYWFNGNVGTPDTLTANFKGANYTGRQAGYYTAIAVDKITRCVSARSLVQILDQTQLPIITTSSADQTSCNTAAPNGQVSANINGTTTGYTFTWYSGSGTGGAVVGNTALVNNRSAGIYTVRATNTTTGCSNTAQVSVVDNKVSPVITQTIQPNTNCAGATPTGSITLQVNGGADAITNYTITWYEGNGTTTPLGTTVGTTGGTNKEIAQALRAGSYTVRVTDNVTPNTSCSTTQTFTVTDNLQTITLENPDLTLTHDSNCSPDNGAASVTEVTVNGAGLGSTTGYTFTWLQSNGTTPVTSAGSTATIAVPLSSGNYYVRATNSTTKCTSPITPFTINDTHVNPTIASSSLVNNTNCGGTAPNGSITITVDGVAPVAGQHTIQWFVGSGTTTPLAAANISGTNNRTAQGLAAGTYTVRVTDTSTPNNGCVATATFTINNVLDVVTIDNADLNLTHDSNCSPDNGSATVNEITVNGTGLGSTTGYTFTWLQSNGTTPIAGAGNAATIAVPLASGNYYVRATNTSTNCSSTAIPFTINDTHVDPVIAASTLVNNTNCAGITPNGSITITVDGVAPVAGQHTVQWFVGSGTTTPLAAANISGTNNRTAQGLAAGTYTVRVTDTAAPNNGCVATTTFTINNVLDIVTIENADLNLTHDSNCSPDNGYATVNEITVNGTGLGSTAGYTFTWLQSNGTTPIAGASNAATIAVSLASGNYYVRATNITTNCSSTAIPFTINDTHVNPVIAASTLVNNTNCPGIAPNGSITITVDGVAPVAGQHTIQWFIGSGTTTPLAAANISGTNNRTAQGLTAGTYTVRVSDTAAPNNGCVATATFTINNVLDVVTIENADLNLTHDSNCSPDNGLATVNEITVNGAGLGSTTGYTFTWLQSNGTTPIAGAGNAATIAVPLASGNYYVRATNTTTNCSSAVIPFTINDIKVNPVIALASSSDNTNCDGVTPNGSITITVDGVAPPVGQYTIQWFEGNGTTTPLGTTVGITSGSNNETAAQINGGTYTVRVVDSANPNNNCAATATFTINDNLTLPTPSASTLANTACDPTLSDGSISVTTVGGESYLIFKGQNTLAVNDVTDLPSFTADDLSAGIYTIEATIIATGCTATTEVNVDNAIVVPILDAAPTDVTSCAPPNGSVTASITNGVGVLADYTFRWYNGSQVKATPDFTETGATLNNIPAGFYTVSATNNLLGCEVQQPVTVEVINDPSTDILITELLAPVKIPASDCTNGNGQLGASASSPANVAGFTFEWWEGDKNLGMTLAGAGTTLSPTSNQLSGITYGPYTVIATDNTTGCFDSLRVNLPFIDQAALLSIETLDQTDCINFDGGFKATVTPSDATEDAFPDIDQTWYQIEVYQNGILLPNSKQGEMPETVITGLKAGNYTVLAREINSSLPGCTSEPSDINIVDATIKPTIVADVIVDNKNCIGALNGTGSITLEVDGSAPPASHYTYAWHNGQFTSDPSLSGNNVLSNLIGGPYTVEVTNTNNNCKSLSTFNVSNVPYVLSVPLSLVHQTDCAPENGTATVTDVLIDNVSAGATFPADFTFKWYESDGTTIIPSGTSSSLSPLGTGDYFVSALNTTSNCESPLRQFAIEDVSQLPIITALSIVDNANCTGASGYTGSITILINGSVPIAGNYTMQWHTGTDTSSPISGETSATLSSLEAGDYTVEVTDISTPNNSCSAIATFTVTDNLPKYSIVAVTPTHQTDCTPNGDAQVTDILVNGVSNGGTSGFTFEWFDENGNSIEGPGATDNITTSLAAGNYRVIATNTTSMCSSAVALFTINDISTVPAITLNAPVINNSNCFGVNANGSVTIDVNGSAPLASEFSITWYNGIDDSSSPIAGETSATLNDLAAGDYTVKVVDLLSPGSTCFALATFTIINNLPVYTIDVLDINVIDQTDCTPNGDAVVTDVLIDGVSNGGTTGFTFEWFDNSGASIEGPLAGNDITTDLAAGNYSVMVTNTASACSSGTTSFIVNDVSTPPAITLDSPITNNTNCEGTTANGSITIDVDGVSPLASDYSIQWFNGSDTSTPIAGATTSTLANLEAGDYTVQVTDILSPGSTCMSIATFTVVDDLPLLTINIADIDITDQSDCTPNGDAVITDIIVDGVSNGGTTGFTFEWFDSSGASIEGPMAGNDITLDLEAGNYSVMATNTASTCATVLTNFTVNDVSASPVITLDAFADNTNCTVPNGSITVDVNGSSPLASEFTLQWFSGSDTTSPIAGATSQTLANLSAGDYTVQVTDILSPGSTCLSIATFSLADDLPVYTIDANITVLDQTDCTPNGDAIVTDILVDGVPNGSTTGFTFEWFDDNGNSIEGPLAGNDVTGPLAAGNYSVVATNTLSTCNTILTPFTVDDTSTPPAISLNALVDNTNCTTPNGSITIDVNGVAPLATEFAIQWFSGTDTSSPIGGATTQTLANLSAGEYTVQVIDILSPGSTCLASATFAVADDLMVIGIDQTHIAITHQSNCTPINGSATVNNLTVNNGTPGNTIGYTFAWFESDGTTPIAGAGNSSTVGVNLAAGDYYVQAINTATTCSSPLTPFTIEDISINPTVVIVQNFPNISCNTNYTGELSASVSEGTSNGITAGYQFEWFRGVNNTNPADLVGTGTTISNLQEGDYTVLVTDMATPGNGCINTASINLKREIPILTTTLSVNNQTVCLPINGLIQVVSVQQTLMGTSTVFNMSNAADLANFSFQWFDENLNPLTAVISGSATPPNLPAGTYYVEVTNTMGCSAGYSRAVIEDTTVHPEITLDDFDNPSVCILPETTGNLTVIADGSLNFSDYTFTWHEGNGVAGAVVEANNPILSNIAYTNPLTYTVRVTNNTTNCFSDATYTFATDTLEIRAIASAVPLTSCVTPNGSLFSNVQNGSGALYDYEWYSGTVVGTTPVFTSNEVLIAPMGTYTVIAKHPTLNFCPSIPGTVEVTDGRMYPQPELTLIAPLTYCDPNRPNGVAKAEVNGMVTGYVFEWYEGSPSGNLIYTGSEAGILRATTYYVKAIDVISGCDNTASIVIANEPVNVLTPQVEVLSERTDCLNPNGVLTASVNGNIYDYYFLWYNGNNVKSQPDVVNDTYYDLYAGNYTVAAKDRISGCISQPVTQPVVESFNYPEFEVMTAAANCDEQNGRAEIKTIGNAEITSVEWDVNGAIEYGPTLNGVSAGTYVVTATSVLNCSTTEEFTVEPDITVYNGISRNNDGANDFFEIGCINDFPNNSVQIFNREGTLVYEAKYYDNQETFFNGISNRGISLLGNELPSGTYFYIIDKGNGSKPRTGYLELMQ